LELRLADVEGDVLAEEKYVAEPDLYRPGDTVNVDHVLISSQDWTWPQFKERLDAVLEELSAGADFIEVAKQYSDDPSAERNGGRRGFIKKGQTHPAFEEAAFALNEAGQLSEPVFTSFGAHIIRFNERRESARPTFPQVKDLIIEDLKKARSANIRESIINQVRLEADPSQVAVDLNVVRSLLSDLLDED
jgi:parvulin-like peptidyl-prolyl isomerase